MADKAKIFISSAAQERLKQPREQIYNFLLNTLKHQPEMYEKTFGPYPAYESPISKCLEKVRECDIFILIIADKAGTIITPENKSVTHLEFLEAYEKKKHIFVFVEDQIHSFFFQYFHKNLAEIVHSYRTEHGGRSPDVYEIVKREKERLSVQPPGDVDDYIWAFLFDIVDKDVYYEKLHLLTNFEETLAVFLSDSLRQGSKYIPLKQQIDDSLEKTKDLHQYLNFSLSVTGLIREGKISDWRMFLAYIQQNLSGGVITTNRNSYVPQKLCEFGPCSGVSLYRKIGKTMQKVAVSGIAKGEPFYDLYDQESFVSQAMRSPDGIGIAYEKAKQTVYVSFCSGIFVLTLHFPLSEPFNEETIMYFKDELISGILMTKANSYHLELTKTILGGVQDE